MMNLMFWKKKPDADSDSANSDSKESQEESSIDKESQEAAAKPGMLERVKAGIAAFTQRFRKTPAFKAEIHDSEDQAGKEAAQEDKEAGQNKPAEENSDPRSSEQEATPKQGLFARIKGFFSSRFKKAPAADTEQPKEESQGSEGKQEKGEQKEDGQAPAKPGLIAKIKSRIATLFSRSGKTAEPAAGEEPGDKKQGGSKKGSESGEEAPEEPGKLNALLESLGKYKSYLIGALVFLLLCIGVYAAWDTIFPPLVRKPTPHVERKPHVQEAASQVQEAGVHADEAASQVQGAEPLAQVQEAASSVQEAQPQVDISAIGNSEEALARVEVLKKQSEEALAKAEALKKEIEAAQAKAAELKKKEDEEKAKAEALKKKETEKKAQAEALRKSSRLQPGEVGVGSSDHKAAVQALKEAIKAMNGDSPPGGDQKKPSR